MPEPNARLTKPEEEELAKKKAELSVLESELAEQELCLTALRSELSAFEVLYLKTLGSRYAELDEIEAKIAERQARLHPSKATQHNAAEARERAATSRALTEGLGNETGCAPKSTTLKSLYREVAKRIHPDLATDPMDRVRREQLMADANRAYEAGDEERLRTILHEYEASPESFKGEGTAAELVRVIRKIAQIKKRLARIEHEIEILKKSELFELKIRVERATSAGRDLLQEMAEDLSAQIELSRQRLQKLPLKHETIWTSTSRTRS